MKTAQKSFEALKKCLARPPITSFLKLQKELVMVVDASRVAVGSSLLEKQGDGRKQNLQYASHSLSKEGKIQHVWARGRYRNF